MLMSVECPECGHRELGAMEFCAECGAAVFSTVVLDFSKEDDDDHLALNLVDSGEISYLPQFLQTVACRQLREICEAARLDQLSEDGYQKLLAELEVYIEREIVRFDLLPEFDNELYSSGCLLISDGLESMAEACAVAADYPRQGKSVLNLAQKLAADADAQIGEGRRLLERLARSL